MRSHIRALISVSVILAPGLAEAQTVVESGSGKSSIIFRDNGLFTVSFADAVVKLALAREASTTGPSLWRFGAEGGLRADDNGFAGFVDSRKSRITGSAAAFVTWLDTRDGDGLEAPTEGRFLTAQWVTVQLEASRGTLSLTDGAGASPSRSDTLFMGIEAHLFYNALLELPGRQTALVGAAAGFGRRNNYDELARVQVCETVESSGTTRLDQCRAARFGTYGVTEALTASVDVLWYPSFVKSRLAVDGLFRYDGARDAAPASAGVGIFAAKEGSPTTLLGGILAEFRRGERPRYGFQIGIPF